MDNLGRAVKIADDMKGIITLEALEAYAKEHITPFKAEFKGDLLIWLRYEYISNKDRIKRLINASRGRKVPASGSRY